MDTITASVTTMNDSDEASVSKPANYAPRRQCGRYVVKWFDNQRIVNQSYAALAAIFNTASVFVAWSTETKNQTVKFIAQCMIAASMGYSILHGASEYECPPVWFVLSYSASLVNVWSSDVSESLGFSGITSPLVISGLSFLITCCCDKKIMALLASLRDSRFTQSSCNDPFAFLRLWKNFFGKLKTGLFSMVGVSLLAGEIVEWLSFIEPLVFISLFFIIVTHSDTSQLALPRCRDSEILVKCIPCLVMLVTEGVILTIDSDRYFYNDDKLPLLDMVGLLIEACGYWFILPLDNTPHLSPDRYRLMHG